ncbi:MAG: hypothetical protein Q9192_008270, partial [Flavoplaca navasiana]
MRLIYKHAARTIVWLGPKTPGLDEVFQLSQIVADIRNANGGSPTIIKDTPMGPVEQELDIITEILDAHPQVVMQLVDFFDREYFMRI